MANHTLGWLKLIYGYEALLLPVNFNFGVYIGVYVLLLKLEKIILINREKYIEIE